MANTIDWGEASVNNTNGYGKGATNNTIRWGKIYESSASGETNITGASGFSNTLSTRFDGVDDFVTMGDVLDFERTSAFSISAWVARAATGINETIVAKMESSGNFRGYILFINSSNQIRFILRSQNTSSKRLYATTTATITDTNWHHITLTYSGNSATSGIKIYIDGVSVSLTKQHTLNATTVSAAPFQIGARNGSALFSKSAIDEVAIFNTELSASDVTTIYNSGVPNDLTGTSGLVSWFRMGDGDTFPTISDNVGSNNGTMTNMSSGNFISNVPT
tara:strand:- start:3722 stop:4555 length:834 start_codon:yes stop_codon:yes gene_type:complete